MTTTPGPRTARAALIDALTRGALAQDRTRTLAWTEAEHAALLLVDRAEADARADVDGLVALVEAWAACVRRLMAVAPTGALMDETGVSGPHSTPPDRRVIREAALRVVDGWLERDRALLAGDKAEAPTPCCDDKGGAFCRDTTGAPTCFNGWEHTREAGDKAEAPE